MQCTLNFNFVFVYFCCVMFTYFMVIPVSVIVPLWLYAFQLKVLKEKRNCGRCFFFCMLSDFEFKKPAIFFNIEKNIEDFFCTWIIAIGFWVYNLAFFKIWIKTLWKIYTENSMTKIHEHKNKYIYFSTWKNITDHLNWISDDTKKLFTYFIVCAHSKNKTGILFTDYLFVALFSHSY